MILKEWQDAKGNKVNITQSTATNQGTSAGSFKKRFEKLLAYAQAHKNASVNKTTVNSISDNDFSYTEKIRGGYSYYDREITVYIGSQTEAWRLKIYIDNKPDDDIAGQGWPELLKTLRYYITVPVTTTLEYKELLTEWVDSNGKKVSINSSSASQPASTSTLYKDKFKKLLDYHIANDYNVKHGSSQGTIEILSEDDDKALFKFKDTWEDGVANKHETITAAAYFKGDSTWWVIRYVDGKQTEDFVGSEFNELIKKLYRYFTLPPTNSSEYQDLLESSPSFAEDFKAYENLWD